jgi:hypothetical protein
MKRLILGMCLLAATGCLQIGPTAPAPPVDRQVVLAPGTEATVSEAGVRIRFERVANDSRCPGDALCLTGGDAIVQITVIPVRGNRADYELHTGPLTPVMHDGLTISLVELSPYPFASRPFDPAEYRVTLRVKR